jgi:hypothetical protein
MPGGLSANLSRRRADRGHLSRNVGIALTTKRGAANRDLRGDREYQRPLQDENPASCGEFWNGSDGTRTRDLRRDRCAQTVSAGFA